MRAQLDADLTVLRGWSIGGMRFFGVMRTPSPNSRNVEQESYRETPNSSDILPPGTLLLVSKYAEKGNLLDYLDTTLTGIPSDWKILIDLMSNLCSSLFQLHEANIIHR